MCDRVAIIQNGKLVDVRLIKEFTQADGKQQVVFEVASMEQALTSSSSTWPPVEVVGDELIMNLDKQETAAWNRRFVEAGIAVYGIRAATKSLEDQFLEMTGSDPIA